MYYAEIFTYKSTANSIFNSAKLYLQGEKQTLTLCFITNCLQMFEKEQKIINELNDRTIQSKSNTDVLFKPKMREPSSPLLSHWRSRMWKSRVEKWVLEEALNNSCARQRKWSPFMWAAEPYCQTLLINRTLHTMHLNVGGMAADTNDLFSLMNEVWREPRVSALSV